MYGKALAPVFVYAQGVAEGGALTWRTASKAGLTTAAVYFVPNVPPGGAVPMAIAAPAGYRDSAPKSSPATPGTPPAVPLAERAAAIQPRPDSGGAPPTPPKP